MHILAMTHRRHATPKEEMEELSRRELLQLPQLPLNRLHVPPQKSLETFQLSQPHQKLDMASKT